MSGFSINDNLSGVGGCVECVLDALLQLQHHGACGVDDVDATFGRRGICRRGFTVGTQQHFDTAEVFEVAVCYRFEPATFETLDFIAVVDDVAKTIERRAASELFLGFSYGTDHTMAESRPAVNLNQHGALQLR